MNFYIILTKILLWLLDFINFVFLFSNFFLFLIYDLIVRLRQRAEVRA
jgi:hypothetical protein